MRKPEQNARYCQQQVERQYIVEQNTPLLPRRVKKFNVENLMQAATQKYHRHVDEIVDQRQQTKLFGTEQAYGDGCK